MGRRYRINIRRLVIISLVFLAVITGALLVLRSLLLNMSGPRELLKDAPQLERVETESGTEYLVPDSRVPETFAERMEAAPLSLLPSRVPGFETSRPPAIPLADQRAITRTSLRFLNAWETFGASDEQRYRNALNPLTTSDYRAEILERADSAEPDEVCADADCLLGSAMVDGSPRLRIIDWNGAEAFVVGSGLVSYSFNQLSNYSGEFWSRSYGLVLKKEGSRWVVARAAAENTAAIES